MIKYKLTLYVTGKTARSAAAINNITQICEQELQGDYDITVVDVIEHPEIAEEQKIMATPTLVKTKPEPSRRVIGDINATKPVLLNLDIVSEHNSAPDIEEVSL
ncbi:circadian clock KaiB family protein [Colwellia sp. C1TZA3]|uniref:circadian clock KaiB family protein n=1 Tax=Colwellia sp. C1TZA3 TaxID=2508879 RepID=UPI0011B9F390|nr:circadian clock KaiB family protein [Colwellia sp. C1TZA3]TWX73510.1 circadian clock protein KaiB [Colwellia sp. C1TZA3]